jgi:glycosyltransferase involved in cell wall biosynthesis
MPGLSVVIITRNEEANIRRCLDSVKGISDEIVVVDDHSTDKTAAICSNAGCKVILHEFEGFGRQKQFAVSQASNDWILSIDADEVVTHDLAEEIRSLMTSETITHQGYSIPFSVYYLGRLMKHSGMRNETHLRLFNRVKGKFREEQVHEGVEIQGTTGKFKNRIVHYSYRDLNHHLEKINLYTSAAAGNYLRKGKQFSKIQAALKFPVSFFIFYFLKGGILDGYPGFMWSFLAAFYGSLKIAKTIELTKAGA